MKKSASFTRSASLLTGVDFNPESQQASQPPLSDAEVDFNSEPNAIPLSSIHHSAQPQKPEQKTIIKEKPDAIESKTIGDTEREFKSDPERVHSDLSIRDISDSKGSIDSEASLYDFLHSIGINRTDIQQAHISEIHLLKLF